MAFLLDTHIFIWDFQDDEQLTQKVAEILDTSHDPYISMASLWEIAIKLRLGKLTLQIPFQELQSLLEQFSIQILSILFDDTVCYLSLPLHHRDPFDRILVAPAIHRSLSIVSVDAAFDAYQIQRVWV